MSARNLLLSLLLVIAPIAQADELQDRALAGQAADVVTTAVALTVGGLTEGNPLGLALIPLKAGALYWADGLEDPAERADVHRALSATGWGPAVNNICAIAIVASGGSGTAPCLALGIVVGIVDWSRTAGMRAKAIADTRCERDSTQCQQTVSYLNDLYVN